MGEKTASSLIVESSSAPSIAQAEYVVSQNSSSKSELADEVFSLFKGYLTSQLEEKGKQFERSAISDKEATDIKYKGNRKQLEVNLRLGNILTQIDEGTSSPADIHKLIAEGKLIIKKRQKLIKLLTRTEMVGLLSESMRAMISPQTEDEKKIRKAKAAAEKKRKEAKTNSGNTSKKFKSSSDFQLFRGKTIVYFHFVKFSVLLVILPEHPTIKLLYLVIYVFKEENNLRSSERSELELNDSSTVRLIDL